MEFAAGLSSGDIVALTGELGAGKTEFARGICQGLGYSGEVSSPSFVRVHYYNLQPAIQNSKPKIQNVIHSDFYLAKSLEDALDYGLDELYGGENLILIEWAERFPAALPKQYWHVFIEFSPDDENHRRITINKRG